MNPIRFLSTRISNHIPILLEKKKPLIESEVQQNIKAKNIAIAAQPYIYKPCVHMIAAPRAAGQVAVYSAPNSKGARARDFFLFFFQRTTLRAP